MKPKRGAPNARSWVGVAEKDCLFKEILDQTLTVSLSNLGCLIGDFLLLIAKGEAAHVSRELDAVLWVKDPFLPLRTTKDPRDLHQEDVLGVCMELGSWMFLLVVLFYDCHHHEAAILGWPSLQKCTTGN